MDDTEKYIKLQVTKVGWTVEYINVVMLDITWICYPWWEKILNS